MTAAVPFTRQVRDGLVVLLAVTVETPELSAARRWLTHEITTRSLAGGVQMDPAGYGLRGREAMASKFTPAQRRRWSGMGGRPRNRTLAEIRSGALTGPAGVRSPRTVGGES